MNGILSLQQTKQCVTPSWILPFLPRDKDKVYDDVCVAYSLRCILNVLLKRDHHMEIGNRLLKKYEESLDVRI